MVKEKIKISRCNEIPKTAKLIGNILETESRLYFSFFTGQVLSPSNLGGNTQENNSEESES